MKLTNFLNLDLWFLAVTITVSWTAFVIFSDLNLILSYNDSMSHLNISRLIVDNMEPGLAQLGGVWLPMSHLLPLVLVWNYSAWQSGFAGSLISMTAFVTSSWAIYKTVQMITFNRIAGLVAGLNFILNLNMLYLQATPLTESLYLAFFSLSVYYFVKWLKFNSLNQLLALGILGFFQVLTRYDGWFVTFFEALIIGAVMLFHQKDSLKNILGKLFIYLFPIGFGLFLWIAWNILIFGDPLFFATGQYSAQVQQETINKLAPILTKHNIFLSIRAYSIAVAENIGPFVMLFSLFGAIVLMFRRGISTNLIYKLLILSFLLLPVLFNILSLFLGFSIVNVPSVDPANNPAGLWFNVRYGILALPFVAVMIGIFASRQLVFTLAAVAVIFFQFYVTFNEGLITVYDGAQGASSFVDQDVASFIKAKVSPEEKVLLSTSYFNPLAFKTGIPLKQIIHEGVSKQWVKANIKPQNYSEWIVMSNQDVGEPLYTSLIKDQKGSFLNYYQLEYQGLRANIYHLKPDNLVQSKI